MREGDPARAFGNDTEVRLKPDTTPTLHTPSRCRRAASDDANTANVQRVISTAIDAEDFIRFAGRLLKKVEQKRSDR